MKAKHPKTFLRSPQATLAGFFVLVQRRLFKGFKKIVAGVLVFTFSFSQLLLAADPRELLLQAKAGFDIPDSRRGGGESTPEALSMAQAAAQETVDNRNALANLGNMNFSLTTQNGDILRYVNNTLSEVQTKDGTVLQNIKTDDYGIIQDAHLKLSDGSIQVYEDGKVIGYMTPDGTTIEYDVQTGRVVKTTTKTGIVSDYTYQYKSVEEDAGCDRTTTVQKFVSTTIKSEGRTAIYNASGHLQSLKNKDGSTYSFNDGVLQWVLIPDVGNFTYNAKKEGTNTRITLNDTYNNSSFSFGCDTDNNGSGPKPVYYTTTTSGSGCDGDVHTTRQLMPNTIPSSNPESILYDKDHNPLEVVLLDGTHFYFTNGVLKETRDKYGRVLANFNFESSSLGNITQTSITQNNLNSTYDSQGSLLSIKLNDMTIFYKDSKIDSITKTDGTELEALSFNATTGTLENATIITPDGEVRTYVNGELKSLEQQDTKIFYDLGKPLQLIQKDLVYNFGDLDEITGTIAANLATTAPDALTAIKMEYDSSYNLKKVIRQNNEILSYLNNDLKEYSSPDEATRVFDYTKEGGEVLSYTVTQGDAVTYYDKNHQVLKSIISSTTENPHTLEVIYQYGKIRKILKDTVETFKYEYVFDTDGSEKTLIHDLEENVTKTYKAQKLLTAMTEDTSVLSTYSYDADKVSKVDVTRLGRTLHTYVYSYSNDNTLVTDEENVIRTYDANNKLTFLEKEKQKWGYSYKKNSSTDLSTIQETLDALSGAATPVPSETPSVDDEIVTERLLQKTLSGGSTVSYGDKGQVEKIDLADGTFITDVVLNDDRSFRKASVHSADGSIKIFNNSTIEEEIASDGTHFYYTNGLLSKATDSAGKEYDYTYDKNSQGAITAVWIAKGTMKLKYNLSGDLVGAKLNNILDVSAVSAQTAKVYEGMWSGTGPLAEDGDLNTAAENSASGSGGGGRGVYLYVTHDFPEPQSLSSLTFKMVAKGYSNDGKDWRGYSASIQVEVKVNDAWVTVPGSSWSHSTDNRTSGEINFDPGLITLNGLSIQNVQSVRAYAHGFGNSSYEGSQGGSAAIYEFGYTLYDQSYFSFNQSAGNFIFSNVTGGFTYNASGALESVNNESLRSAASSIETEVQDMARLPYLNKQSMTTPTLYTAWLSNAKASILDSQTIASQEYSSSGQLETQIKADKTVTLFNEKNKPVKVLDEQGNILIEYSYDTDGNPSKVYLKNARDTLPDEINKAELSIEKEKTKTLQELAQQKNLAYQSIESDVAEQKQVLQTQLNSLQNQYNEISGMKVSGKKAKNQRGDVLNQITDAMSQVRSALTNLYQQESEAYEVLDTQIKALSDQIEADTQTSLTALHEQEELLKKEILRQEVSPIIYDYYRRILGRDPSGTEYDYWINKLNYNTGTIPKIIDQGITGALYFSGQGDYLKVADSDDWNFGTGDFTIDTWIKLDPMEDNSPRMTIFSQGNNFGDYWQLDWKKPYWSLSTGSGSGSMSIKDDALPVNQWFHLALVRDQTGLTIYRDGQIIFKVPIILPFLPGISVKNYSGPLSIGALYANQGEASYFLKGSLNQFRVSKELARWTSNFIPPADYFASDANTQLFLEQQLSNSGLPVDASQYSHPITSKTIKITIQENLPKALSDFLNALPELANRKAYVQAIKLDVKTKIQNYLTLSQQNQLAFAQSLGLSQDDLIDLSQVDAGKILTWLDSRSLHFGQSAFISLEMLLDQKGITYNREDLAQKCILIDILTGVISPLDDGDLVISVFALNKVASLYGVSLSGANLSWEDLKKIYDANSFTITTTKTTTSLPGSSIQFDGSGDYVSIPDSNDWSFGDSDFTMDLWTKFDSISTNQGFISQGGGTNDKWQFYWLSSGVLTFYCRQNGSDYLRLSAPWNPIVGQWAHLALVRKADTFYFFVNGQLLSSKTVDINTSLPDLPDELRVGTTIFTDGQNKYFNGLMDGVGIAKGSARWTSNFTPPTQRVIYDSYTKLLLYTDPVQGIQDKSSASHPITLVGNTHVDAVAYKQTIETVSTHKEITHYPTSIADPDLLTAAQKQDIIDHPEKYNPRVIAHINGNHFIIITGMTSDTITYIDPGIGKDKENESLTVMKEGFLKAWKGNVTYDASITPETLKDTLTANKTAFIENQTKAEPEHKSFGSRFLVSEKIQLANGRTLFPETMSIRGAFWGSILGLLSTIVWIINPALGLLINGLRLASLAASIFEKDWLSAATAVVSLGFGDFGKGLGEIFKGAGPIGQAISGVGQFFGNVFQSVQGFFSTVGSSLSGFLQGTLNLSGAALKVAETAVSIGVNYGVSRGLETIGVNPQIAGFLGSLTAGGIIGGMKGDNVQTVMGKSTVVVSQAQYIQSSIQQVITLNQVGRLGMELGLDSSFSNIIGLSLAAIQGNIITSPGTTLGRAFSAIKPDLITSMSQYGLGKLSGALGLPSIVAQAAGIPILSGIGQGLQNGNIFGQQVIQSIQQGLFNGAIAYAADFASGQITDSTILHALSTRVISGAIEGVMVQGGNLFKGVYEALKQSVLGAIGWGNNVYQSVNAAINFTSLILQHGFSSAMEIYLTDIFNRDTVESIYRSGGIASALLSPKQDIVLPDGTFAKKTVLGTGEGILFDSHNNLIGFERNGMYQTGKFGIGSDGSFGLITGKSFGNLQTGQYYEALIQDGKVTQITTITTQGRLSIHSDAGTHDIRFDVDGNISDGQITMGDQVTLTIANGTLDGINVITDAINLPIDAAKDLWKKYSAFMDEVVMKEPQTNIVHNGQMVVADMKLDWIGNTETVIKDFGAAGALFWIPANVRWAKAIANAFPQITDLMKDSSNKFIFTPGVNSGIQSTEHPDYRSMSEIQLLADSFSGSNQTVMFAHSAGTEAQLKAILKAKQDGVDLSNYKFVFASPRVKRSTFDYYLDQAGVRPDQVLVVTAAGDYEHWPTDVSILAPIPSLFASSWFDYANNKIDGKIRYNYLFLEKDLTSEDSQGLIKPLLGHGAGVDGAIDNHEYQVVYNGERILRVRIRGVYNKFGDGNI